MLVYRVTHGEYANDLTGYGAMLAGGRWNPKGTAVIYTASTKSLATLELLVHVKRGQSPVDLSMVTLELPDSFVLSHTFSLPPNWRSNPPPDLLAAFGKQWLDVQTSVGIVVPSAVTEENNILLNPRHPDFQNVRIAKIEPFILDMRLMT